MFVIDKNNHTYTTTARYVKEINDKIINYKQYTVRASYTLIMYPDTN